MKRIICLITALCLVFGSFSFCFAADWSDSDKQNLQNAAGRLYYMNQSAAYYLYNIATNTNNIYNKSVDIYNALFNNGHNITYWVHEIEAWMSPIYNALVSTPVDLATIIGALGHTNNGTYYPYLRDLYISLSRTPDNWSQIDNAHSQIFSDSNTNWYSVSNVWGNGIIGDRSLNWLNGSPIGNLSAIMQTNTQNQSLIYQYRWAADLTGYNSSQTYYDSLTLNTSTFTPTSMTNGLYTWLSKIQQPAARLAYVLASPERIAAQEAAADNEEAVVDNFIDSSGNASASTSDIGSISDLSSGYKSNFGSDASVSGIFNIFNSNNMRWFSQETANQLDTTTPTRRGSSFETPLLDQQIDDIYNQIGVKHD